jgi:hypothetical protein
MGRIGRWEVEVIVENFQVTWRWKLGGGSQGGKMEKK